MMSAVWLKSPSHLMRLQGFRVFQEVVSPANSDLGSFHAQQTHKACRLAASPLKERLETDARITHLDGSNGYHFLILRIK